MQNPPPDRPPINSPYWTRYWVGLAVLIAGGVAIAAGFWIAAHPYGTNWDEARYINRAVRDGFLFWREGPLGLLHGLMAEDRTRPPAYRLLVLPFTLLFGAHTALLRWIALATLGLSLVLTFWVGKRIAGPMAGAWTVATLCLCPAVVAPGMRFYVDFPYYLAIAATLYFWLGDWHETDSQKRRRQWLGLGLAMGLGLLAKPPYLLVITPMLGLALLLHWRQRERQRVAGPALSALGKSVAVAWAIALPWWLLNCRPAFAKAFRSSGFVRHSLGPKGSPEALLNWLYVFGQSLLGPALAVLMAVVLVTALIQWQRRTLVITRDQGLALTYCLVAALPTLILSTVATNQNPRLIAPVLLPLLVVIGVLATLTQWTSRRWLAAIATIYLGTQFTTVVSPTPHSPRYQQGDAASETLLWGNPSNVMQRAEQRDWRKLYELVQSELEPSEREPSAPRQFASGANSDLAAPAIAYMGGGSGFTAPEIAAPWIRKNRPVALRWLWRYEAGTPNWDQIMESVAASHVVMTALDIGGNIGNKDDEDNRYNVDLIKRLAKLPYLKGPFVLNLGRFDTAQFIVFIRQPGAAPLPPDTALPKLDLF